jgi:hypothetical protein
MEGVVLLRAVVALGCQGQVKKVLFQAAISNPVQRGLRHSASPSAIRH